MENRHGNSTFKLQQLPTTTEDAQGKNLITLEQMAQIFKNIWLALHSAAGFSFETLSGDAKAALTAAAEAENEDEAFKLGKKALRILHDGGRDFIEDAPNWLDEAVAKRGAIKLFPDLVLLAKELQDDMRKMATTFKQETRYIPGFAFVPRYNNFVCALEQGTAEYDRIVRRFYTEVADVLPERVKQKEADEARASEEARRAKAEAEARQRAADQAIQRQKRLQNITSMLAELPEAIQDDENNELKASAA